MNAQPPPRVMHAMQRALDALSDPDRTIFMCCRLDGWDTARIALDLGIAIAEGEPGLVRAILALQAAARRPGRRSWYRRVGRIGAWLSRNLPQG